MTRDEKITLLETALEQAAATSDWNAVAQAIVLAIDDGPTEDAIAGNPDDAPKLDTGS